MIDVIKLTEYEIKLLRHLNGEKVDDLISGAAMGEAVEHLYRAQLARRDIKNSGIHYTITEKGRELLKALDTGVTSHQKGDN